MRETIIEKIKEVTQLFYQQKTEEGYVQLQGLIGLLASYVDTIEDPASQVTLLETLKEAVEAMENQDTTLLADLLQYELIDKL